ncbi:calcium-binding protein 8-like protein [Turdus rufiventris]|nr:calcium-binding protein 8-like protein [Turdus rufiventris]
MPLAAVLGAAPGSLTASKTKLDGTWGTLGQWKVSLPTQGCFRMGFKMLKPFTCREKMPFHHVTAGLLYKGNYLNRSLSAGSDSEQLANISVEELDEIREAFRVLDRDGNGFISKQELGMAMRSLGYMPSEVELAIIMQRLDMDGNPWKGMDHPLWDTAG